MSDSNNNNNDDLLKDNHDENNQETRIPSDNIDTPQSNATTLYYSRSSRSLNITNNSQNSVLSQWTFNNNRMILDATITQTISILNNISIENNEKSIYFPNDNTTLNLNVLKLNLKIDGNFKNSNKDFNLNKDMLSNLLNAQFDMSINHLKSLKKRVNDISSKVFITGDINTGKSNLCNSLLKRYLLPEDQLPCTNVFCEVLEAKENNNIEEVHAIPLDIANNINQANDFYDIQYQHTYEIFPLNKLSELVYQNDKFILLKIYIKDDKTSPENSLLRNNIMNITLIDSPGLNVNSIQTAEVMTRQEEIDLVIFVINAENQLTLSAKEFINLASREKKLMFFVIKKFDKIMDKDRCRKLILKQIQDLSPETYKRSSEFIHFISNFDPPDDPNGGSGDDSDENNDNPDENDEDFEKFKQSLKNFVLKKRSESKLLPAKTYIIKILNDIILLSNYNIEMLNEEEKNLKLNLEKLKPDLENKKEHYKKLTFTLDQLMEDTLQICSSAVMSNIQSSLDIEISDLPKYSGILSLYDFVYTTEKSIKSTIIESIDAAEIFCRKQTESAVTKITNLGKDELDKDFMINRSFQSNLMFTKEQHHILRTLNVPLLFRDMFSPSWTGFLDYLTFGSLRFFNQKLSLSLNQTSHDPLSNLGLNTYPSNQYWLKPSLLLTSKVPALAIYSFGGIRLLETVLLNGVKSFSWAVVKKSIIPLCAAAALLTSSYLICDISRAVPLNLLIKYKKTLKELDYDHSNSERICNEVRNVLKVPTRAIISSFEMKLEEQSRECREIEASKAQNALSTSFFKQILDKTNNQKRVVDSLNLDID